MTTPYRLLGTPKRGGVLIVADHASNHVPDQIDLGVTAETLATHIAWDIGVAAVAEHMTGEAGFWGYLAAVSRLVVDCNRNIEDEAIIPLVSDGIEIIGNRLGPSQRAERIGRFYHPYHDRLSQLLTDSRPALILSLHSFTPCLKTDPDQQRPWQIGILYNEQDTASKLAIRYLEGRGIIVGDQLPYSGVELNSTMNRHAESNNFPYIGVEIRQDMVSDESGQARFAQLLIEMSNFVLEELGLDPQRP